MPYTKIIRSGNNLEVYEYEKEPSIVGRRTGKRKADPDNVDMGASGEDTLPKETSLGKRKDNARHATLAFRRIVLSNLSGTELPILITPTYKENMSDLATGYKDYRAFIQALRYKYGKAFKYICVPEFQKRGAIHFHALFWGLPSTLLSQERKTREIAMMWGKGFVYLKKTDGNDKLSSYLAKYMSKTFKDDRLKNMKAYTASRNISRPETYSGEFTFWPIIEEFEQNGEVITDRSYDTKWQGPCRYRHLRSLE